VKEPKIKVELLGDNFLTCQRLKDNIEMALQSLATKPSLQFVYEPQKFAEYRLMSLPALAVDGEIKAAGKLLSTEGIILMLKNRY